MAQEVFTKQQTTLAGVPVELAQVSDDSQVSLRVRVNSGEPMPHAFFGTLAIDLEGLSIPKKSIPILRDHDGKRVVGFSQKIEKRPDGLFAEGIALTDTPDGAEVVKLSRKGFPWQASMWVPPSKVQILAEGQSAMVNGFEVKGPGAIFRKARLREITVTAMGVDENTETTTLSDDKVRATVERTEPATGGTVTFTVDAMQGNGIGELLREGREAIANTLSVSLGTVKTNTTATAPVGGTKMSEQGGAPPLTLETLRANHADVFKAASEAGVASERARVLSILSACDGSFAKLANELIEGGASELDAVKRVNKELQASKSDKLAALRAEAPKPVGNTDSASAYGNGTTAAQLAEPGAEATVEEWTKFASAKLAAEPELKHEFGTAEDYAGWLMANANGCVRYSRRKES